MSRAYTPGLQVSPSTTIEKVRELPLLGRVLVKVGDRVEAKTPVLAAELPGELEVVRIADLLGIDPGEVAPFLKVKPKDRIKEGEVLYEKSSFFGLFTDRVTSPAEGTAEYFLEMNGHLGVRRDPTPIHVGAYVSGGVCEVVEGKSVTIRTRGALLQGIFGVGGERLGVVHALAVSPSEVVTARDLTAIQQPLKDAILVGGMTFERDALEEAARQEVAAVITGSIRSDVLFAFAKREIGVSVTGDEDVPFSLLITEGFGALPISERAVALAKQLHGRLGSVSGQTQVRAGALRPELIVSGEFASNEFEDAQPINTLEVGARIRCIRVPYFGELGTVTALPQDPFRIPTGAEVRVLHARLDSGAEVTVPRANVELIA